MLRDRLVAASAIILLAMLSACGIKGPLVPAPNAKAPTRVATPPIQPATVPGDPERKP